MVLKIAILLTLLLSLYFTLSGTQRRDRQCLSESAARGQAEKTVLPDYPTDPESAGLQGLVFAAVLFDQDGNMAKVKVFESPGTHFAEAATRALEQWKLKPIYNGAQERVETQTGIRFHFIFADGKGRVEAATDDEQKDSRFGQKACVSPL